jgi:hypothetical protein
LYLQRFSDFRETSWINCYLLLSNSQGAISKKVGSSIVITYQPSPQTSPLPSERLVNTVRLGASFWSFPFSILGCSSGKLPSSQTPTPHPRIPKQKETSIDVMLTIVNPMKGNEGVPIFELSAFNRLGDSRHAVIRKREKAT